MGNITRLGLHHRKDNALSRSQWSHSTILNISLNPQTLVTRIKDSTCDADLVAFDLGCFWPVALVSDRSRSVDLLDSILGSADPHDISDMDEAMHLDAAIAEIDQSPTSKLNDALTVLPKDIQKIVVDKVLSEVQPNPGNLNCSPQFLPSLISLLTTCSLLPLFSASLSSGSLNLDICCQGHESLHHATETFNNEL